MKEMCAEVRTSSAGQQDLVCADVMEGRAGNGPGSLFLFTRVKTHLVSTSSSSTGGGASVATRDYL